MSNSGNSKAWFRAVVLPTAITLLVLAAIVGTVLEVSTGRTDALALARQNQRVRVAIEQGIRGVAIDQEASTYWDDAVVRTRQRPLDLGWIDNNLGIWFHTYYKIDEAYLVDPHDRPVYAMQDGRRAPPASFDRVAEPALKLAVQLRSRLAVSRLAADRDGEQTAGASGMARVGGRPAFVSLKPILSETGDISQPRGSEYLHVAVRYLDGSFLDQIAKVYVVDNPRFTATATDVSGSVALRTSDGRPLGYISWKPFEPGGQVAQRIIPVLSVALLIVGLLVGLLLRRVQRSRVDLERSREHAQHLAFHDSLTGLPNRSLFEDRLRVALSRRNVCAAVLLIDLDRFKNVNDTLGHQAGDALIRQFAKRLMALTRDGDTIARLGGDEFAIVVEGIALADVRELARRILADARKPFPLDGAEAYVGASVGVALADRPGTEALDLVRRADIALYAAKDAGRGDYRLFSPEMDERIRFRGTIEAELREAAATGAGLQLHYQPQVSSDGAVIGVEALLRWESPDGSFRTPDQFLAIAEETGLIVGIGDWVLRQALLASRRWPGLFVGVNLSPAQFRAPGFLERLMRIVRETGADPAAVQLEITERVLLEGEDSVHAGLAQLRSAGFKIVLDDFGTGFSSLSYLRKFKVDKIKIDGSFVQHLEDSPDSPAIVTAVLALGWALGLTVAAEGVETAEQCTFLEAAGCTELQGYYFSPAVPADEIAGLLTAWRRPAAA